MADLPKEDKKEDLQKENNEEMPKQLAENLQKAFEGKLYDEVIQLCNDYNPKDCTNKLLKYSLYENMGLASYRKGDYENAKIYFKECLVIDANSWIMHYHVGLCELLVKERSESEAFKEFNLCLQIRPEAICAIVNKSFLLNIQNKEDETISFLKQYKDKYPIVLRNYAYACLKKNQILDGIESIRKCINYFPYEYQNWMIWGKLLKSKYLWEEALEKYQIALKLLSKKPIDNVPSENIDPSAESIYSGKEEEMRIKKKCDKLEDMIRLSKDKKSKSCCITI